MASLLKWLFGDQGGGGGNDEDDDQNQKKKTSLPKSSHAKDVGAAKSKIHKMEKQRQNLYAKAKMFKEEATEFGKKAGACKNASRKATYKRQGLAALKKSKMYEGQAVKIGDMLMNYELTTLEADGMSTTVDIVNGIKEIKGTMAAVAAELDGDEIHNMMGEIENHMDDHADIVATLSNPLSGTVIIDEVEMEDEFDALMDDEADRIEEEEEVNALRQLDTLDKAPTKEPTKKPVTMDAELQSEGEKEEEEIKIVE